MDFYQYCRIILLECKKTCFVMLNTWIHVTYSLEHLTILLNFGVRTLNFRNLLFKGQFPLYIYDL